MEKILNYLDGKKLYLVGVIVAVWGLAKATWPDVVPAVDADKAAMLFGVLVIILRSITKKPGALTPKAQG